MGEFKLGAICGKQGKLLFVLRVGIIFIHRRGSRGIATKIGRLVILSLYHSYAKKSFWGNRFFQQKCRNSMEGFYSGLLFDGCLELERC